MKTETLRGWRPFGKMNPAWKDGLIKDRAWVHRNYVDKRLSLRQLAEKAGCSLRTAARCMDMHGIETRKGYETRRFPTGSQHHNWTGSKVCPQCGSRKSGGKTKVCISCRDLKKRGSGNPNWKGGRAVRTRIREAMKQTWRPKVFSRDNYTCLGCGDSAGRNLQAHHIRRLAVILDWILMGLPQETEEQRNYAVDAATADPLLTDIGNGITLCKPCHRKIHLGKHRVSYPLSILTQPENK